MRLSKIALAAASVSLAFGTTAAQANVCQPGSAGCVLPLPGPPAPAPVVNVPGPVVGTPVVEETGFNFLPFVIGAVLLAALAGYFLLDEDEDAISA